MTWALYSTPSVEGLTGSAARRSEASPPGREQGDPGVGHAAGFAGPRVAHGDPCFETHHAAVNRTDCGNNPGPAVEHVSGKT